LRTAYFFPGNPLGSELFEGVPYFFSQVAQPQWSWDMASSMLTEGSGSAGTPSPRFVAQKL